MSRPRLKLGPHLAPGLLAVFLFTVFALVVLGTEFSWLPEQSLTGERVTEGIGFALLDVQPSDAPDLDEFPGSDGFLAALILVALVLDAALDGAVHLASREDEGSIVTALAADRSQDDADHTGGDQA
jgi:hypothetical protein